MQHIFLHWNLQYATLHFCLHHSCQVPRIERGTHAFECDLTLASRLEKTPRILPFLLCFSRIDESAYENLA